MLSPADFREIVSGRRRGPVAALARLGLAAIEVPYTWAVRWRNYGYDRGHSPAERVSVPVVSVGNLTLGGTGKTPLVAWIARHLLDRGLRVTLISRGYGAERGKQNDEARELAEKLPGVPHLQNPDRVSAAHRAIAEHHCEAILLDDGFQHRRIARDLDIVLLDAADPFGGGRVFPRGMLREPIAGLRRADVVALSRADMATADERKRIRDVVAQRNPAALWIEMCHAPQSLRAANGQTAPLDSLRGVRVAAFCGIGNPAGFRHTLAECGYNVAELREFPDHHAYTEHDAAELDAWAKSLQAQALVCTHKDLVKLAELATTVPLWAVEIGLRFTCGEKELRDRLNTLFEQETASD